MSWEIKSPNDWHELKRKAARIHYETFIDEKELKRLNRILNKLEKAVPIWIHYTFLCNRRAPAHKKEMWQELELSYRNYINQLGNSLYETLIFLVLS